MKIYRKLIEKDEIKVPSIVIEPENPIGCAVVVHGYGGCKEEQLGLAARISGANILTCTIDLRGHGENPNPLNEKTLADVNLAADFCKNFGKTAVVGHSLGGRLALLSKSEYKIGIAPALCEHFCEDTRCNLEMCFSKRVVDDAKEDFLEIFYKLPMWDENLEKANAYVLYAQDDIPEIKANCQKQKKFQAEQIDEAGHSDIYLYEETFAKLTKKLTEWFD